MQGSENSKPAPVNAKENQPCRKTPTFISPVVTAPSEQKATWGLNALSVEPSPILNQMEDPSQDDLCRLSQEPERKRIKLEDSFTECHINDLPNEVMRHIFSFLFTNDKLSASLVCRAWLNAMDDPVLMDDICVNLMSWKPDLCDSGGKSVYFSRRFSNFVITLPNVSPNFLKYSQKYGENIRELTFSVRRLNQNLIHSSLEMSYCCKLEKLTFINCKLNIFCKLHLLKEFTLNYDDAKLTDHDLVHWSKAMPNVECLQWFLNQEIEEYIYVNLHPSKTTLSLPVMLDFFKSHQKTLTDICIENDTCEGDIFTRDIYDEIFQMQELKLKKLDLDYTMLSRSFTSVSDIVRRFSALTNLGVNDLSLKDEHLNSICTLLPNLTHLSIYNCKDYTSLKDVFRLKCLQTLKIRSSVLENKIFEKALGVYRLNKLKEFTLSGVHIQAETLLNLLSKMAKLIYLELENCDGMSDRAFQYISEHLVRLRDLIIHSDSITDRGIFSSTHPNRCLSNIKGLRKLTIYSSKLSAEALYSAVKFLELESLIVHGAGGSFNLGFQENNPSLRNFHILK